MKKWWPSSTAKDMLAKKYNLKKRR
jgi:hypothetical protein